MNARGQHEKDVGKTALEKTPATERSHVGCDGRLSDVADAVDNNRLQLATEDVLSSTPLWHADPITDTVAKAFNVE